MTKADVLTILKSDLEISTSGRDEYLSSLIDLAETAISREGITLDIEGATDDAMLVESYAAFLYRKRREDVYAMPRSLRYLLNNRLFAEKAKVN